MSQHIQVGYRFRDGANIFKSSYDVPVAEGVDPLSLEARTGAARKVKQIIKDRYINATDIEVVGL